MNGEIISIDTVKKIKELEKENKKLKKDILGLNKLATELHSEICKKQQEINRLNDNKNKAVKYMKNYIEVEDAPINERVKIEFQQVINILNKTEEEKILDNILENLEKFAKERGEDK